MSSENLRPIIIKRKKVSGGDGHHGGAWKVAYADFVTAMMAFFMLMWLLNATTEKQRKGLADYFAPTIAISRVSGGGDGALGGDSFQSPSRLPGSSTGQLASLPPGQGGADTALSMAEETKLKQLATGLAGKGGDSLVREMAARHINAEITDEGLVILVSDLEDAPLFDPDTGAAKPVLKDVLSLLVEAFSGVDNRIAISSHAAGPTEVADNFIRILSVSGLLSQTGQGGRKYGCIRKAHNDHFLFFERRCRRLGRKCQPPLHYLRQHRELKHEWLQAGRYRFSFNGDFQRHRHLFCGWRSGHVSTPD